MVAFHLASATGPPDNIARTVAIIALVLSAASLGWQIAQFRLAGARVETELRVGARRGAEIVHGPPESMSPEALAGQGFDELLYAVQVRNKGRLTVSVTSWAVAFDNGSTYSHAQWAVNDQYPLPYRLEPGAEAAWFCPADQIRVAVEVFAKSNHPVRRIQARVGLGTGKTVTSKTFMDTPWTGQQQG